MMSTEAHSLVLKSCQLQRPETGVVENIEMKELSMKNENSEFQLQVNA